MIADLQFVFQGDIIAIIMNTIAQKIEALIDYFGDQREVAKVLRISMRHLFYLKKGQRKISPHLDLLIDLAMDHPQWFYNR